MFDWQRVVCPGNSTELQAVEADGGRYLGYVRAVGRRQPGVSLDEPIVSFPTQYMKKSLLRDQS